MTSSSGWALGATVCAVIVCAGCGGKINTEIAAVGDAAPHGDGGAGDGDPSLGDQCGSAGPEVEETSLGPGDVAWDATVVHVVTSKLVLDGFLRLAPCTIVRFGTDGSLVVHDLEANGTAGHPVTLETRSLPQRSATIEVGGVTFSKGERHLRLEEVRVRNVFLLADDALGPLFRNVRFAGPHAGATIGSKLDPASNDIVLEDTAIGTTAISFRGRGASVFEVVASAPPLRHPAGHENKIGLYPGSELYRPERLGDRGVPYRWFNNGTTSPQFASVSQLTIDPGVTIEFDPMTGFDALDDTFLVNGTSEKPVTFRGHAGGAWLGVRLARGASLHHLTIADAGRAYDATAACTPATEPLLGAVLLGRAKFPGAYEDVRFENLPGSGFVETYVGTSMDLITGHSFVGVTGCKQIVSRDLNGNCPVPVPCAK